jgi:pimeloyl-ACP methyl ester carboxylesterase
MTAQPETFVFIHGGYDRGSCFDRVAELLRAAGHVVYAPDLPPNSELGIGYAEITLDTYASYVTALLERIGHPVILVGHSLGGLTVSLAAQRRPDLVRRLIYLSAMMLPPGESVRTLRDRFYGAGATLSDAGSERTVAADGTVATMGREGARKHFFQSCALEDQEEGLARLRPQPLKVYDEPLNLTSEGWGSVPRHYIIALRDQGFPPRLSAFMIELVGVDRLDVIDSDHCSFLSAPRALTRILARIGKAQ